MNDRYCNCYNSDMEIINERNLIKSFCRLYILSVNEELENFYIATELKDIRAAKIEDLAHTPLSNAFRHYLEFATGIYIDKIF